MIAAGAMALALAVDGLLGWPAGIYARIGHPVTWIGRAVNACDRKLNRDTDGPALRRLAGILTLIAVTALAATPAYLITLIAARSLYDHVIAVAKPLSAGDTSAARQAVSMIVGRDPAQLDPPAIARAALESLAENTSDGIVAPIFWGALLGLPGIAAYKAINTLDSMIVHRTPRFTDFGWASARFDDLVNLAPARLTGLLFAAVSGRWEASFACMRADAAKHRSPNAGWPEAAMAGALSVRLSGPRVYADRTASEPWVNAAAPDPSAQTLTEGLTLYRQSMLALGVGLGLIAVLVGALT